MKKSISLLLLLFLVGNVLGGSVTGVYAEEMYKPASEEEVIVEQAADVPDMEAYEPEPNEDRTVKNDNVTESLDTEYLPDDEAEMEKWGVKPDDGSIIENAGQVDMPEEDDVAAPCESAADPVVDTHGGDVSQADDEELTGATGYVLRIVWLDGGNRNFSLEGSGNLTDAKQKAANLLQRMKLKDKCALTVNGNVVCAKITEPVRVSSNLAIIAHMGYFESAPENTLSSIRMAAAVGFREVEFDIRFTKDGVPVLLHDEAINNYGRTTDGKLIENPIYVRNLTYAELQTYDFGIRRGQMWKGEKAPTLDSALKICAKSGLRPNLDIKWDRQVTEKMIDSIYALIEKHGLQGKATYLSNDTKTLKALAQKDPDSNYTYIVFEPEEGYVQRAEKLKKLINGKMFIYVHEWLITEAVERTCRFHSIPLNTTVKNISQIAGLSPWVRAISSSNILPEKVIREAEKRKKNPVISYDGKVRNDRNYWIYASLNCGFNVHSQGRYSGSGIVMWNGNGRRELNDFRFEPVNDNLYRILSTDSMLAVSADKDSDKVVLCIPGDGQEQLWKIEENLNRTYTFINAFNGKVLLSGTEISQGKALLTGVRGESSAEQFFLSCSLTQMPGGNIGDARRFSDVQDSTHPYYLAVYWASWRGIAKGFEDGSFGLNLPCTRGQAMMLLWRYAGKPAPKTAAKSPFADVSRNHTFYKAVLWAYQQGVTKGYSDGTFGIDRSISRGEFMMFLWRLKGKPAPAKATKQPFCDVSPSNVFYRAILWGAQNKIAKGYMSEKKIGTYGPGEMCTRGQIVTFLYRAG